jgi:hypothetical protein
MGEKVVKFLIKLGQGGLVTKDSRGVGTLQYVVSSFVVSQAAGALRRGPELPAFHVATGRSLVGGELANPVMASL